MLSVYADLKNASVQSNYSSSNSSMDISSSPELVFTAPNELPSPFLLDGRKPIYEDKPLLDALHIPETPFPTSESTEDSSAPASLLFAPVGRSHTDDNLAPRPPTSSPCTSPNPTRTPNAGPDSHRFSGWCTAENEELIFPERFSTRSNSPAACPDSFVPVTSPDIFNVCIPEPFTPTSPAEIHVKHEIFKEVHEQREIEDKEIAAQTLLDFKAVARDAAIAGAATQGKPPSPVRRALNTLRHLHTTQWISSQNPIDEWGQEESSGWTDYSEMVNAWPTPSTSPINGDEDTPPSVTRSGEQPAGFIVNDPLARDFYKFLIPDPYTGHVVVAPYVSFNLQRQKPTCIGTYGTNFPRFTRSMTAQPVDYLSPPLTPEQLEILDPTATFAPAINKVLEEYFPCNIVAAVRQYQYFKETEYAIQKVANHLRRKEIAYLERAVCVLSDLENANFLGRLMAHLDIIVQELEVLGTGHMSFHHAIKGFENEITNSATDTRPNPFRNTHDPRPETKRRNAYKGAVIPDLRQTTIPDFFKATPSKSLTPRYHLWPRTRLSLARHASFDRKKCHKCGVWGHVRRNCPRRNGHPRGDFE